MWLVDLTLIKRWLDGLDEGTAAQVVAALRVLEENGPNLGRPLVDSVAGSRHRNMKELRPGSTGGTEIRVLFAFDPQRRAIMLIAGDKSGDWNRWYRKNIPVADALFDEHKARLKGKY